MPPVAKRNQSVILYDVYTSPAFAEAAKKCLLNIYASKWFADSKDFTKLMLINTSQSRSKLHAKFGKSEHIFTATDVVGYDPKLLKPHIEDDIERAEADWLMGLASAIEELQEDTVDLKGVMTLQLVFITDLTTPVVKSDKRINYIIEYLNKLNIFFYILGPKVKVPHLMSTFEDIENWMRNIEFVDDVEENQNLLIAKEIVENANHGIICDLELGQELFKCYSNRWGLQPWRVPLTIASSFTTLTATVRFLRPAERPKFKQNGGFKVPWNWCLMDDITETVPYDNVIGGIFKHGKFVPLPPDVEANFKHKGPRCFTIIGFTNRTNVSELYMQGNGSCYVESDGSKNFKLMVHTLAKMDKCAIAQRVYMQNCRPKLVALIPDSEKEIFILVELAFAENIMVDFVEQSCDEAPKLERKTPCFDAMYEYLQKLDVSDPNNVDANGSVKVPLAASLMDHIQLNIISRRCLQMYLEKEINLEDTKIKFPDITDTTNYKQYLHPKPLLKKEKESID